MAISNTPLYLSTLLLEKNRWNGKGPALLLADHMEDIAESGFVGLEVWMNHLYFISRSDWEIIREKAQDLDLPIALISSDFPSDSSEKSRRFRDGILEACDYFQPDGLHVTSGDFPLKKEKSPISGPAWQSFRDWSRDLSRNMPVFIDFNKDSLSLLDDMTSKSRDERSRYRLVVEPIDMPPVELARLLGDYVQDISHVHLHAKDAKNWVSLRDARDRVLEAIAILKKKGYKGSWSLYLTRGTGTTGESVDVMLDNAERDLNFLNSVWSRLE